MVRPRAFNEDVVDDHGRSGASDSVATQDDPRYNYRHSRCAQLVDERCLIHYADVRIMPTLMVSSLVAGVAGLPKSA
jgi:hypothetical protein